MPHESGVIALLFNTYKAFFRPSTDLDAEQEHWKAIKKEINGEIGLSSRKFHELWPHMLIHYSDELPAPHAGFYGPSRKCQEMSIDHSGAAR